MSAAKLFHYTQCGLDNVWLANGYRTARTAYGRGFAVERMAELHDAIARWIVDSPRPLRGQDVRYLRVMLDLSQADLGRLLGVSRATVIRWENAPRAPLGRVEDIAMRATWAARTDGGLVAATIRALQEADEARHGGRRRRAVFEARRKGWKLAA